MSEQPGDVLQQAAQRLHDEFLSFRRVRASLEGSNPDQARHNLAARVDSEPALRKGVDEACRHWIANGQWPMMNEMQTMLATDRFPQALSMAAFLQLRGLRFHEKPVNEALEFFLIDCWEAFGRKNEMARLIELR